MDHQSERRSELLNGASRLSGGRRWDEFRRTLLLGGVLLCTLVLLLALAIFLLPSRLAQRQDVPRAVDRIRLQNEIRGTLIQALAGLAIIGGGVLTLRGIQVNREGQITERFTRAIDQLGSKVLEVRIGAIYALERLARDSRLDRQAIIEILTAYLREHARHDGPLDADRPSEHPPPADIQALLTVIRRRHITSQGTCLDGGISCIRPASRTE